MTGLTLRAGFGALLMMCILAAGCGGDNQVESALEHEASLDWPATLPTDGIQPWETDRTLSALDAGSEFTAGADRFLEGGTVLDAGSASRLGDNSGSGDGISYAMYRLPMGGFQPGALAFDVNILPDSSGSPSEYYIGLSNYSSGRWEWHGPYSEHHVRLARSDVRGPDVFASEDYTSEFDNLFVNILVSDDNSVDVIGVSSDSLSSADQTAPDAPDGLAGAAIAGGVSLTWNPVAVADLAGYRIHYSDSDFSSVDAAGVRHASFVEGSTRHILSGLSGSTYVRVSAVDNNGNESEPSDIISVTPLAGNAPVISVQVSGNDVPRNALASISVSGEITDLLFDYDLDGDGIFEVIADSATSRNLPTGNTGLIRPAVRASDTLGERVALGGVSLLVTSNSRPVATSTASPQSGTAPLDVAFDGTESTDFDGTIVGGGWDFDGDGIYDAYDESSTDQLTANNQYATPGFFNARLRVLDDQGAWDVDSIGIFVDGGTTQDLAPVASLTVNPAAIILGIDDSPIDIIFDASDSFDPEGGALEFSFDVDNNGSFAAYGPEETATYSSFSQGLQSATVRVRDEAGNISTASVVYPVYQFNSNLLESGIEIANATSILSVDSILGSTRIGIAYYDSANDDLRFTYSTDQNGYSWVDSYVVDSQGGEWMDLFEAGSRFGLVWYRDGDLFFAQSNDEGKSFAAPQPVDDGPDDSGLFVSGIGRTGGDSFAYYNETAGDLYFTTEASGGGFETPVNVDGTGDTGLYPDLLYNGARMNIAYYRADTGNLMFARSTDSDGLSWGSPVIVDGSVEDVGMYPSLIRSGSRFYIAYVDWLSDVWFVKSSDSNGTSWEAPLNLGNTNADSVELMFLDGRFTIFIGDGFFGRGEFNRSTDSTGTEWGSWEYYDYGDTTGFMSATTLFNGMPGLAYWDEDNELYFNTPRFD